MINEPCAERFKVALPTSFLTFDFKKKQSSNTTLKSKITNEHSAEPVEATSPTSIFIFTPKEEKPSDTTLKS